MRHLYRRIQRGFTLVEVIIYCAILAIVLVALATMADIAQKSRARFQVLNQSNTTASRMMDTVDLLVRNSDGFVTDVSGTKCVFGNKLWLYYATSSAGSLPAGCLGGYASGAVALEPYEFIGATTTPPHSPWNALYGRDVVVDTTFMYGAGSDAPGWYVVKRYLADMKYDTGFDGDGAVYTAGNYSAYGIAKDNNYLYVVGGNQAAVETNDLRIEKRRVTDGSLVTTFDNDGIITSSNAKILQAVAIDSVYLYSVGYKYNSGTGVNDWYIEKRRLDTGALDTGFNSTGYINGLANGKAEDIALDTVNGYMYVAGVAASNRTVEKRLLTTGAYVTDFDTDGYWQSSGGGAASQGPYDGSTFANSGSGVSWTNPSNAQTNNGSNASVSLSYPSSSSTKLLQATDFTSFAIPADATISGITVAIEKKSGILTGDCTGVVDASVRVLGGSGTSTNKASGSAWPTSNDQYVTYGSAGDLWGVTWTPDSINGTSFGAEISGSADCVDSGGANATIDHIRVTVNYVGSGGQYYAVTVEKPIEASTTYTAPADADAYMISSVPNNNYGRSTTASIGKPVFIYRLLMKFDVSRIPRNKSVSSATIVLTCTGSNSTANTINVYPLLRPWAEGEGSVSANVDASWNYADYPTAWGTAGADNTTSDRSATSIGSAVLSSSCTGSTVSFSLSGDTVSDWINGRQENFGVVFIGTEAGSTNTKTFGLRNYATYASRPYLSITLANPDAASSIYLAGDNGSDLIVEKKSMTDGSAVNGFGTGGTATAAATTNTGMDLAVDGDYVYTVGHSSTDWYMEKRYKSNGQLVPQFGTGGSITAGSTTYVPNALALDEDYMYLFGSSDDGSSHQYIEKRFRGSGAYDRRNGVRLICYQDYPNNGRASSCYVDPPHDAISRFDLTDPLQLYTGLGDMMFTTTTIGSAQAVEALISLRFRGDATDLSIATVTASTTTKFRISNP